MEMFNPPHPGRVLKDVLSEIPMTIGQFAPHIGVSRVTLSRGINGRAGITPEMSIKLSQAFGQPSADIWFKMQAKHDFWHASRAKRKKSAPSKSKPKCPKQPDPGTSIFRLITLSMQKRFAGLNCMGTR